MTDSTTRAPFVEAESAPHPPSGEEASGAAANGNDGSRSEAGPAGPDRAAVLQAVEQASSRRRWPWLAVGAAAGAAVALATSAFLADRDTEETAATETVELASAEVEQRDLTEEIEWDGALGYGDPVSTVGTGGVVTAAGAVGDSADRGDVVMTVDDVPVVVLFGSIPMWRALSEGSVGPDVRRLDRIGQSSEPSMSIESAMSATSADGSANR